MELLQAVEQLAPVQLLKASFVAYPLVNALHIATIGVLFTSVFLLDLRLLGAFGTLPKASFVPLFRRLSIFAFGVAAATGFALFSVKASDYAAMPIFLLKLGLIAAAIGNFIGFMALDRGREASEAVPAWLRLSVVASMVLWTAVLISGRFIGFV